MATMFFHLLKTKALESFLALLFHSILHSDDQETSQLYPQDVQNLLLTISTAATLQRSYVPFKAPNLTLVTSLTSVCLSPPSLGCFGHMGHFAVT